MNHRSLNSPADLYDAFFRENPFFRSDLGIRAFHFAEPGNYDGVPTKGAVFLDAGTVRILAHVMPEGRIGLETARLDATEGWIANDDLDVRDNPSEAMEKLKSICTGFAQTTADPRAPFSPAIENASVGRP